LGDERAVEEDDLAHAVVDVQREGLVAVVLDGVRRNNRRRTNRLAFSFSPVIFATLGSTRVL
jgi:hypothetical protein